MTTTTINEPTGSVAALTVFDDGGGPALYAGGYFSSAGGVEARAVDKWNGTEWSALGSGMGIGFVNALAVFDDGSSSRPALYAAGDFTIAGGVAANRIAKWDGTQWSSLNRGMWMERLLLYEGNYSRTSRNAQIGSWDGGRWSLGLPEAEHTHVAALTTFDDGSGLAVYEASYFDDGYSSSGHLFRLPVGDVDRREAVGEMNAPVRALTVFANRWFPTLPALYVGGDFNYAGGVPANHIAKWDGHWSALDSGIEGSWARVDALTVFDDGRGPALYVGGWFSIESGGPPIGIAEWRCRPRRPPPSP